MTLSGSSEVCRLADHSREHDLLRVIASLQAACSKSSAFPRIGNTAWLERPVEGTEVLCSQRSAKRTRDVNHTGLPPNGEDSNQISEFPPES